MYTFERLLETISVAASGYESDNKTIINVYVVAGESKPGIYDTYEWNGADFRSLDKTGAFVAVEKIDAEEVAILDALRLLYANPKDETFKSRMDALNVLIANYVNS